VTCHTCFDQIAGCAGGNACQLLTGPVANSGSLAGLAGAAAAITCLALLPPICLRVLTRSVLDCMRAAARRPAPGAPLDLTVLDLAALMLAARSGQCSYDDAVTDVTRRLNAATTQLEVNRLSAIVAQLDSLRSQGSTSNAGMADATSLLMGAYTFAYAHATRVVRLSRNTVVAGVAESSTDGNPVSRLQKTKILRPTTMEEFSEMLNMFIMVAHATGLVNCLVLTEFLRVVVYETIGLAKKPWTVAHELMLTYFEELETTSDTTLHLGNILQRGSLDTMMRRAEARAQAEFPRIFRPPGQDFANGKFSRDPKAPPCHSFNNGKAHPPTSLDDTGACKYRHVCNHWVTDKGPKGICGGAHPRTKCTNPKKCDQPVA
jgi:hypothetical protein